MREECTIQHRSVWIPIPIVSHSRRLAVPAFISRFLLKYCGEEHQVDTAAWKVGGGEEFSDISTGSPNLFLKASPYAAVPGKSSSTIHLRSQLR